MMDVSKIESVLPDAEVGEIRPCTTPGAVQFHLLAKGKKKPTDRILDVAELARLLDAESSTKDIKLSQELGVVRAKCRGADISALASGRVVVRSVKDEKTAQNILETLAPIIKESLF